MDGGEKKRKPGIIYLSSVPDVSMHRVLMLYPNLDLTIFLYKIGEGGLFLKNHIHFLAYLVLVQFLSLAHIIYCLFIRQLYQGMNVSSTTGFFADFGRVGRVFLQPDTKLGMRYE